MSDLFEFGGELVWEPSPDLVENTNLTAFMRQHGIASFDELNGRSAEDVAWFTDALIRYLRIEFYEPYSQVIDLSDGIQWPKWCVDGKLNIVHNCLDKYTGTPLESKTAYIWEGEEGQTRSVTYGVLCRQVNQVANALRELGLGKGDAVGIFMPMTPELVAAFLAIAKIGAIIVPLFSGYGVSAVATRLQDTGAKVLFTVDGFLRRGKPVIIKPVADEAAVQLTVWST
jgi:acetyl-CoA synthetase